MKPERWQQIEQLYHAALEREPDQRAAFLEAACAEDQTVRQEVESLLAYDERAQHFIETPPDAIAAEMLAEEQSQSLIGSSLDHYRILSLIGRGGMGEVYSAVDTRLGREVAIKILLTHHSVGAVTLRSSGTVSTVIIWLARKRSASRQGSLTKVRNRTDLRSFIR